MTSFYKFTLLAASTVFSLAPLSSAQPCTTCNNDVKVTFKGGMCVNGSYTLQLGSASTGTVSGETCGVYTTSNPVPVMLKPDKKYTLSLTAVPSGPTGGINSIHLELDAPSCYKVFINGSETSVYDSTGPGCGSGLGHTQNFEVILKLASSGGSGSAGSGGISAGSSSDGLAASFSLGGSSNDTAGAISFSSGSITPDVFTPGVLNYESVSPEVEVIRSSGVLRQIKAPETLADIVTLTANSYEIRYYPISQVGAKVSGLYQVTGSPAKVWKFSSPQNNSSIPEIKVTETQGSVQNEQIVSYLSGVWLSTIAGVSSESRTQTTLPNGDTRVETIVFHPTTGTEVAKTHEVYHAFSWGTEKILTIQDPGGSALTTQHAYNENSSYPVSFGRLKWMIFPDGSWERYGYYGGDILASESGGYDYAQQSLGKIKQIFRPWKDSPSSPEDATLENCHVTEYDYGSYSSYFATDVTNTTLTILGYTTEYNAYPIYINTLDSGISPLWTGFADMTDRSVEVKHDRIGRITARFVTGPTSPVVADYLKGRIAYTEEPDGRKTIHTYEKGGYNPTTQVFTPSSTGDSLRETSSETSEANPYGAIGKNLRTIRITGPTGNLLSDQTQVKTAGGYATLTATLHGYDAAGHLVQTMVNGRITYEGSWTNGRLSSETDEQGITTTYDVYDADDRVTQETRLGVITSRVYNPAGYMVSSTRSAGGLSQTTATGYDLAGRVTTETAEDGFVTTTSYPSALVVNRARPGNATEITTRYLDGQLKSITGTGVVARYYDYGNETYDLWTKEFLGSDTSTRNVQSWTNSYGDVWQTAVSGPVDPLVTITTYHPEIPGRPIARTVPGEAPILYEYDADTGAVIREARDLNGNDVIDASSDPINETLTSYTQRNGNWFRETLSNRYEADGSTTPTAVSIDRQQLTGLGTGIASVTESVSLGGATTISTTAINRSTRTVTVTMDTPDSNLDAVQISIDGRPYSSSTTTVATPTVYNSYDGLGRPTSVTSPRGIVTTTAYDSTTGRISSVTRAGKTTSYTYHPTGTSGAGKVATETLPDGKVIRTAYTARGEVFRVWGGAIYPVMQTYNIHGQLATMRTYRAGTEWNLATWSTLPGTSDMTQWIYHPNTGLLQQKIDAASEATNYTYHADSGKLHTRERARGAVTTYTWNSLGLAAGVTHSDGTPSVSYTYDRAGRVKTLTDAAGTHAYDYSGGLSVAETITGGILSGVRRFTFLDANQRLLYNGVTVGAARHFNNYGYSATSRLDTVRTNDETATYGYLANSDAIQSVTFKSGATTRLTATRSYDASDRLDGVTNSYGSSLTQSYGVSEFDSLDRRKKVTREDGTRWNYGYNDKGEVTSGIREKTASPNTAVPGWSHAYTFDEIGNRKTTTTNGRVSNYTANAVNQMGQREVPRAFDVIGKAASTTTVTVNGSATTRLDDYFHKQITTADAGKVHIPYSVAATNPSGTTTRSGGEYLAATPEVFLHDDDGNLTSDGRFTYTWDAENRLIAMETQATVPLPARRKLAFAYDAMGRRIRKTVWHGTSGTWVLNQESDFIHEPGGWNILAERTGGATNSLLRTYTWGTDLSGGGNGAGGVGGLLFTRLHASNKAFANGYDLNGNVTLLVNAASGQAAATYEYGPFGESLRESGEYAKLNPYRFSTKYADDESGLLDYGYRYYNPSTGRWLNRDPIEEKGGINVYGFTNNNPIQFYDVMGFYVDAAKVANTMRASGWDRAQKLMEHFISAPAYSLPSTTATGLSDPFNSDIITMSWVLGNGAYYIPYSNLKKPANYTKAKPNILKQAREQTGPDGGVFGYHYVLGGESDMRKVHQTQVQYSAVPGKFDLNQYDAALHGFNFYSIVAGCATKDSSGDVTDVSISNIGIYMRDSWDFQGFEYLGAWNFKTHGVNFIGGPGYTFITNGDFRDYQTTTGKGGEFWIFSDIENYRLPQPMLFSK